MYHTCGKSAYVENVFKINQTENHISITFGIYITEPKISDMLLRIIEIVAEVLQRSTEVAPEGIDVLIEVCCSQNGCS